MQVNVTGRHMTISEAIRDYVHQKVEHDFADFPRVENVHVILNIEKYRQIAEVVVQGKRQPSLEAKEESSDMYASIDAAVEKVAKQLRRTREKTTDHKSREKLGKLEARQAGQAE